LLHKVQLYTANGLYSIPFSQESYS
jgi:hypothetical protein